MIDLNTLSEVLTEWSYWGQTLPESIPRSPVGLPSKLPEDLVICIQGVRRCGKSTFMYQMIKKYGLDHSRCFFVNFEDPRLSSSLNTGLLDQIYKFAIQTKGPSCVFFLDEIQNVREWEKWIRTKLSLTQSCSFVITGSNATLLSGELGTVLTGRHITVELFPFCFDEFRIATGKTQMTHYLSEGGFPRTLSYENPKQLLREYFTDIIEKDVRRHVAARSTIMIQNLVKQVFESTGSELSQRTLASTLGTTTDTIISYLDACISAYLLMPCPYFSFSEKQRQVRNRKIYPIDTGLKNAIVTKGGKDFGKDFETIVFRKLRERYRQVYYWKNENEVDFVVQTENGIQPIQVSIEAPKDRHYQGVEEFSKSHRNVLPAKFISMENFHELSQL